MHVDAVRSARSALLALALGCAPAYAQEPVEMAPLPAAVAMPADEDVPLPPGVDAEAILGEAAALDPATLAAGTPAATLKKRPVKYTAPKTFDVTGSGANADGSGMVTLKQQLPWDVKVGADLGLAGNAPETYDPARPLGAPAGNSSGAAWASVGLTDNASLDARVDPTKDQGRLAGTLKHSVPVGSALLVTLQNSVSVSDSLSSLRATAEALPVQGEAAAPVFGNEQMVKFNVAPTGTTLAAGLATASNDPITHNKLTAEQKLVGPLLVSTSVTDVGQTTENRSVNAGFKLKW